MKLLQLLFVSLILVACTSQAVQVPIDGDRIILRAGGDTFTINTDGSGRSSERPPWKLKDQPEWSPDGQWVAFGTRHSESDYNSWVIYIMRSDGSHRKRITYHQYGSSRPTWSPDGTRIAYYASDYNRDGIYILNIECVLRQDNCDFSPAFLTKGDSPDWSPDGKRIVYQKDYNKNPNIYVINADGTGEPVNLTPDLGTCLDPKWSPNGAQIAFSCYQKGTHDIFVMNADGSGLVNLTKGVGSNTQPAWSPDGSKIAFISSYRDGLGKQIGWLDTQRSSAMYVMSADGTGVTRLSLRDDEMVIWYTWLPSAFKKKP